MAQKYMMLATLLLLIALLAGCGGSEEGSDDAVAAGKALFNQTVIGENAGCVSCHSLETDMVIVGPSMAAFALEAEKGGEDLGITAEEFIRQSILEPNAVIPEGFSPDTMPQNWGEVLTGEQIDNLVAYLMSLE